MERPEGDLGLQQLTRSCSERFGLGAAQLVLKLKQIAGQRESQPACPVYARKQPCWRATWDGRRLDLAAEIYHLKEPQRLPLVMSPEEAKRLLAMAGTSKVRALLALGYGCGLRAGEVVRLRVGDIDSAQNIIRVVQAKGRKDRHVMLPPEVLGLLRHWWKERPTRHDKGVPPGQRWLFPGGRPRSPMTTRQLSRLFHEMPEAPARVERAWIAGTHLGDDVLGRFVPGDLVTPALHYLQSKINDKLEGRASPRLLWDANRERLGLYIMPAGLVGALWLQFARAVGGHADVDW
jgi:Phage integrase family